jgi:hypothetical protein
VVRIETASRKINRIDKSQPARIGANKDGEFRIETKISNAHTGQDAKATILSLTYEAPRE